MKRTLILLFMAICANINSFAQDESRMYTAFIVNVARNISWNELGQKDDFVITVMGNDDLAASLAEKLTDKFIGLHKIVVKNASKPNEIASSSIVVMNSPAYKHMATIADANQKKQCIIVACTKGQCPKGADMSLYTLGNKLSFQMSDSRIKRHGLTVSAKLRDLGEMVD